MRRFIAAVDRLNGGLGNIVASLALGLVLLQFAIVLLRSVFGIGSVILSDLTIWLHGLLFLLGSAAVLMRDGHVRIDIWRRSASPRGKAYGDLLGAVCFLIPLSATVFWIGLDYAGAAWRVLEGARDTGGLPGVFLLKSAIPLFALLIGFQGIAIACRAFAGLTEPSDRPS